MKVKTFVGESQEIADKKANEWMARESPKIHHTTTAMNNLKVPITKNGKPSTKTVAVMVHTIWYE